MSWNKVIKLAIGRYMILKSLDYTKAQREAISFSGAKKIGILYNASDIRDYEMVKNYVKNIRAMQKDVTALGYVDKKELPENRFAKLGMDFFTRKHLNWFYKPNNTTVSNFINEEFDILITLNIDKSLPLYYITAVSKAKFRVGKFDKKSVNYHDMMIAVKKENDNLEHLLEQVDYYINLINRKNV